MIKNYLRCYNESRKMKAFRIIVSFFFFLLNFIWYLTKIKDNISTNYYFYLEKSDNDILGHIFCLNSPKPAGA